MTGRTSAVYLTEEDVIGTIQDIHLCSNCGRGVTPEREPDVSNGPALYSCPTCGQREEVYWRTVPARVIEDVRVIEEPNIILAEH
jgi:predicted RNA-binding Zn-ribbon protein involved in translation (DUF1610 family)